MSNTGFDGAGPLVGMSLGDGGEVRLPEGPLSRNGLLVGLSGTGKTNFVKRVVADRLERRAAGIDGLGIVVIDPHGDLVRDLSGWCLPVLCPTPGCWTLDTTPVCLV